MPPDSRTALVRRSVSRLARRFADLRAEPERGSVTIEQLMWGLFWLAVIAAASALVGPWIAAKVSSIVGY